MRHYELMVILDPDLEERTIAPSLDRFLTVVTNSGGTVGKVDIWGRRRLAYEIGHHREGTYVVETISGSGELVKEIDKALYNPVWEQVRRRAPWEERTWEEVADAAIAAEAQALANDPEAARLKRRSTPVCKCKSVDRGAIEDAIVEHQLTNLEGIVERTQAGSGCTSCHGKISRILETRDKWTGAVDTAPAAQQAA